MDDLDAGIFADWPAPVAIVPSTASTNDDAKRGAHAQAPHAALWMADHQTAGRGRRGRHWYSPRGENLYLSMLLRPTLPLSALPPFSLVVGLCVSHCIDRACGVSTSVKWPNDIWLARRKLAGVLLESGWDTDRRPFCVVGIGVNVHGRSFPPEATGLVEPVALAMVTPTAPRRDQLALAIAGRVVGAFAAFDGVLSEAQRTAYQLRHALQDAMVSLDDAAAGRVLGVARDGRLRLAVEGRERLVASGEVHWGHSFRGSS